MKKLCLAIAAVLLFGSAQHFYAQGKAVTPPKNSPVRKAILAVVKKKKPTIKKENIFLVQGNLARVVNFVNDAGGSCLKVILKKTGKAWKIVFDHNAGSEEGDDVDDYITGVPEKIKNPWGN